MVRGTFLHSLALKSNVKRPIFVFLESVKLNLTAILDYCAILKRYMRVIGFLIDVVGVTSKLASLRERLPTFLLLRTKNDKKWTLTVSDFRLLIILGQNPFNHALRNKTA